MLDVDDVNTGLVPPTIPPPGTNGLLVDDTLRVPMVDVLGFSVSGLVVLGELMLLDTRLSGLDPNPRDPVGDDSDDTALDVPNNAMGFDVDGSDNDSLGPDSVNGDDTGDDTVAAVELVDTDDDGLLSVDDGRDVEVVGDVTTGKLFSGAPDVDSDVTGVLVVEVLVLN